MIADGGGKQWKTLYSVLRHNAKTLDCYKEPQQLKLKESIHVAGSQLYTFPGDSVAMFKNAHLFGIVHLTKRQGMTATTATATTTTTTTRPN